MTKHVVDVRIFTASQFTIMNLEKYNSLPPDLKKVIDELSGPWGAEFAGAAWDKAEDEGLAAIKAAGIQQHKLSDAQRAAWREKTKVVEEEWVRTMEAKGLPAKQALADLKELLEEVRSAGDAVSPAELRHARACLLRSSGGGERGGGRPRSPPLPSSRWSTSAGAISSTSRCSAPSR